MTEQIINQNDTRSNTTLWILLSIFIVPMILAYGYFFFGDRPSVSSNGELITPVIDIESFSLSGENGELLSREALTPKWRMYYFVGSSCDKSCEQSLYNIRQINVALGKNQDRVEHVIVHMGQPEAALLNLIQAEHQGAIRVYADKQNLPTEAGYIYLMDPLGNVMMRFSEQLNPKLILKDINKLLKISRIG